VTDLPVLNHNYLNIILKCDLRSGFLPRRSYRLCVAFRIVYELIRSVHMLVIEMSFRDWYELRCTSYVDTFEVLSRMHTIKSKFIDIWQPVSWIRTAEKYLVRNKIKIL
jgi:hypothetical protein